MLTSYFRLLNPTGFVLNSKGTPMRSRGDFSRQRHSWPTAAKDVILHGRPLTPQASYRHYVGPDWIASFLFSNERIGPLRIRGNRDAAKLALAEAILRFA